MIVEDSAISPYFLEKLNLCSQKSNLCAINSAIDFDSDLEMTILISDLNMVLLLGYSMDCYEILSEEYLQLMAKSNMSGI